MLLFTLSVQPADWSRAVGIALQGVTLLFVIATSRAGINERRLGVTVASVAIAVVCVGVAVGAFSTAIFLLMSGALSLTTMPALVNGVVRLLRQHGVTIQAVFGALAIYLLLGLVFTFMIGFSAHAADSFYFEQGTDGTPADRVYFSFTTLTTTGFGDLSPAHQFGRELAVLEMLIGQLYLVTVISILVGNLGRRPMST